VCVCVCVCVCIYIYVYLINCEFFNNLNRDKDMAGTGIMAGICTSPSPSPYLIEKVGDSPYPYPVNAGIPHQNRDEFGQYPRGRVYLPSLVESSKCFLTLRLGRIARRLVV